MAKIYGLFGTMTGKLADTVMSVRNGEQLARKYQPVVYNPSTPAQIAQRAKMKMMSQLSAIMAPVIAIPRQGSVSARNLFTKVNFPNATYSSDTANISLASIQLTRSVVGLGSFNTLSYAGSGLTVSVSRDATGISIDKVAFAVFAKLADNSLEFIDSAVVDPNASGYFEHTFTAAGSDNVVVYAYGIRFNNENARATFGNVETATAETVAKLVVTSVLLNSDVTLTKTIGAEVSRTNRDGGGNASKSKK